MSNIIFEFQKNVVCFFYIYIISTDRLIDMKNYDLCDPDQWRIQDFLWGGRQPREGANSRGDYISKNLYVETKESGPLGGGGAPAAPLDPPMLMIFIFFCDH